MGIPGLDPFQQLGLLLLYSHGRQAAYFVHELVLINKNGLNEVVVPGGQRLQRHESLLDVLKHSVYYRTEWSSVTIHMVVSAPALSVTALQGRMVALFVDADCLHVRSHRTVTGLVFEHSYSYVL